MATISAIVITYNEESNIRECLESLKWCDEIIVVDSNSTDGTVFLASELATKIISCGNLSYGAKRNIGIQNAVSDWILWIDADERISNVLSTEISHIIGSTNSEHSAYLINRKSFFINKFIKHCGWYPDYTLRLFRKSENISFDDAAVHEKTNYTGTKGKLKNDILHFTDRNFEHYLNKLNTYTSLSAGDLYKLKRKSSFFDIIFRPVFTFFKMYFLKLGVLDGYMGLVLCSLSSFHVFIKYSKLHFKNSHK